MARRTSPIETSAQKVERIRTEINGAFQADVLQRATDARYMVSYTPTGIIPIDIALGGGIPSSRVTTIIGDFSTLKSLVGLKAIAAFQRRGRVAALIDTEHTFDPDWAVDQGVDVDQLMIQHPQSGELAIDSAEGLIRSGVDLIVFDSVAALLPQAERNKRLFDEQVQPARLAALMSVAMRKLTAANSGTSMIWINQLRNQVGVTFGNPEVQTGGRTLPYYSSLILNIRKVGKVTKNVQMHDGEGMVTTKEQTGQKFKATVDKSKLSRPFREVLFTWDLETGSVDVTGFLMAKGVEHGIIKASRTWWTMGTVKAHGRKGMRTLLDGNPQLTRRLSDLVMAHELPGLVPVKRIVRKRVAR